MAYIPKSQIKKVQINGELVIKGTNVPYKGDAMVFSNGKTYAGNDRINPGSELVTNFSEANKNPSVEEIEISGKYFSFVRDNRIYNQQNEKIASFLRNRKLLPSAKPTPTHLNYQQGYFRRYFAKRINNDSYQEIDKFTFDHIRDKKNLYDYNLYEIGTLLWYITEPDVHKKNSK